MSIAPADNVLLALRAAQASLLFSGPLVREIIAGRKSQTRRVVTKQNSQVGVPGAKWERLDLSGANRDPGFFPDPDRKGRGRSEYLKAPYDAADGEELRYRVYPRIEPGQIAWVRETWAAELLEDARKPSDLPRDVAVWYRADGASRRVPDPSTLNEALRRLRTTPGKWRPSIFLPKFLGRILLRIVAVRVERLQEITEEDAIAEGVEPLPPSPSVNVSPEEWARFRFRNLWNAINRSRGYGWESDPLVWVFEWDPTKRMVLR